MVRRAGRQQVVHALVVAAAIVHGIEQLGLRFPAVDAATKKEFSECRKWLIAEKD